MIVRVFEYDSNVPQALERCISVAQSGCGRERKWFISDILEKFRMRQNLKSSSFGSARDRPAYQRSTTLSIWSVERCMRHGVELVCSNVSYTVQFSSIYPG